MNYIDLGILANRRRTHLRCFAFIATLVAIVCVVGGCSSTPNHQPTAPSPQPPVMAATTSQLTFVQWTDPHLFDAGTGRHGEGVEEEALDNRAALHWAVLET